MVLMGVPVAVMRVLVVNRTPVLLLQLPLALRFLAEFLRILVQVLIKIVLLLLVG
jgi:hypothetical protein